MRRVFLYLVSMLVAVCAYGQGDAGDGTSDVPPLPDLTVASTRVHVGWVRAHAGDERFLRVLKADLQQVGRGTRSTVYVRQLLPGVNYVLVHCRPIVATAAEDPDDAANDDGREAAPGAFAPALEEVRRRIGRLPYVLFCGYNPVDEYRAPKWHEADGGQWRPPYAAEVVPGELVVSLNGQVLTTVEVVAEFDAGLAGWNESVAAGFAVLGADGNVLREASRHVRFRDGQGEAGCTFPLRPGEYAGFVHIDPDNDVRERDEDNNRAALRIVVPPVLMRLTVDEWPGPWFDAPLELLPLDPAETDAGAGRSATNAPGLAVLPAAGTGPPPFRLGIANASDAPVTFGLSEVLFALDGEPAKVIWLLRADDTDPTSLPEDHVVLPPGRDINRRLRLAGDVPPGEHHLVATVRSLGQQAEASFTIRSPQTSVNLFPIAEGSDIRDIRVASDPGNADLHNMLRDGAWRAFSSTDIPLVDVAVFPRHDLLWDAAAPNGTPGDSTNAEGAPVRAWDVEIVLRFAAGSPPPDLLEAYVRSLPRQWFVDDAWLMPAIAMYGAQAGRPEGGEDTEMPPLESVHRVALDFSDVEQIVSYVRVEVPVVMVAEGERAGEHPLARLRRVVAVDVSPAPDIDPTGDVRDGAVPEPYRTYVDFRRPGRRPALAYFPQFANSTWFSVMVDPNGKIVESDEADNACRVRRGPDPEPVFEAEAWVNWNPMLDALAPRELVLTVEGVLRNPTAEPLVLRFPSTLQMDFAWGDRYRWSEGKAFPTVITTVEVGPGDEHVWSLRVPLSELWAAVVRLGVLGRDAPPFLVLEVELVGTDFRDRAEIRVPEWDGVLDEDENLLPDAWEAEYGGWLGGGDGGGPQAEDDADGDGWDNLHEFLKNTDPTDPDSAPLGRLFQLEVFSGWNLVSLPVAPEDADIGAALGEAVTGAVWEWVTDALTGEGKYRRAELLEPHVPYWMFAREDAEIAIPGMPHALDAVRMNEGWNAVGPGGPLHLPDGIREQAQVLYWNARTQGYDENVDGVLEEGLGYWISLPEPAELDVWGE